MQKQAQEVLLSRLDVNGYSHCETVVLIIPLSLSYPIHGKDYERVDGNFKHEGKYYRLVKQKLETILYFSCVFRTK